MESIRMNFDEFLGEDADPESSFTHTLDGVLYSSYSSSKSSTIYDIPEEILEHILGFLSPYRDMDAAKQVSKQWNQVIKSVVKQIKRKFYQNLFKCDINWSYTAPEGQAGHAERVFKGITDRFSHSAVYYEGCMYVFGGCTSTNTTFNDLWKLDLTTRQWIRPIAMGTYPSPKACATMVEYNGNLVLFGGWSHPIPYPLHQSAHYFSELHVYSTITNKWSHVLSLGQEPEALGGHSASVAGHLMVIFGGSPRPGLGTNNLWVFNFLKASWTLQPVSQDAKPEPRYGQFQTTLDERHILVMGGCVGQNRVYSDLWLLTLHTTDPWQWTKLTVRHPELAAPQTWCHAACRVKDMVVVIARSSKVRQTRNIQTNIEQRPSQKSDWSSSGSSSSSADSSPVSTRTFQPQQSSRNYTQDQRDQHQQDQHQQDQLQQDQHQQDQLQQHMVGSFCPEDEAAGKKVEIVPQPRNSLLHLQQRLHRDCMNLPDPSNHHHCAQEPDGEEPEGYFHRISNRWENEQGQHMGTSLHHPQQHHQVNVPVSPRASQQNVDQPQFGSLQRLNNYAGSGRGRNNGCMPSVRPNAMNNRKKQLEALQRQEELLRSKSHALAAARNQTPNDGAEDVSPDQQAPGFISTRNKMDIHVLDISRVLTDGVAEWKPLNELQPPGAPTETICCSVLEGRGELILFGGVVRNLGSPVMTSTAVNKLYVLQPQ